MAETIVLVTCVSPLFRRRRQMNRSRFALVAAAAALFLLLIAISNFGRRALTPAERQLVGEWRLTEAESGSVRGPLWLDDDGNYRVADSVAGRSIMRKGQWWLEGNLFHMTVRDDDDSAWLSRRTAFLRPKFHEWMECSVSEDGRRVELANPGQACETVLIRVNPDAPRDVKD